MVLTILPQSTSGSGLVGSTPTQAVAAEGVREKLSMLQLPPANLISCEARVLFPVT